ncbi:MAG: hypothetical protein MUE86_03030 [Thiobacillaceae bacterium]|jgi:MSHA pilin protein MshA|nr:hypothetical protein [Thiobacillaceae bacterium]MCU0933419.1 hypothetical protein [Thiobacillaceae bacterium]
MRDTPRGFTRTDLIMVLVILGILAAVALPRHYNLKSEARETQAQGIAGAMRSAVAFGHNSAVLHGQTGPLGQVTLEERAVQLAHGYPAAGDSADHSGILAAADIDADRDGLTISFPAPGQLRVSLNAGKSPREDCHVDYRQAAPGAPPAVSLVTTGC